MAFDVESYADHHAGDQQIGGLERQLSAALERVAQLEAALAKPVSSPAGGDVREAFETCAAICEARAEYFDRAPSHREWTDAARSYRATAKEIRERAALSPSTSAAEPVAWIDASALPLPKDTLNTSRMTVVYASRSDGFGGRRIPLYATPPAPAAVDGQRVKAKPLRWVKSRSCKDDRQADTELGQYCAGLVHGSFVALRRYVRDGQLHDDVLARGLGLEDAKAAAQADYEARIRACLATDKEGA